MVSVRHMQSLAVLLNGFIEAKFLGEVIMPRAGRRSPAWIRALWVLEQPWIPADTYNLHIHEAPKTPPPGSTPQAKLLPHWKKLNSGICRMHSDQLILSTRGLWLL